MQSSTTPDFMAIAVSLAETLGAEIDKQDSLGLGFCTAVRLKNSAPQSMAVACP